MKKHIIFLLSLVAAMSVMAQRSEVRSHRDTTNKRGEHNIGWLRSHPKDNWFVYLQGGGNLYAGYEDFKGPLGDHLTGSVEAGAGRWIFPMLGLRVNGGYGVSHGFITLDSYMQNRETIRQNGGYGTCYGLSTDSYTIGSTPITGSLGGYYFPLDGHDDLLIQKWSHIFAGLDVMTNLTYLKRYDRVRLERPFEHIVYIGFNVHLGLSDYHPEVTARNTNHAAEGHIGYILNWNINRHFNIHADLRLAMLEGLFDRERIDHVEKMTPDLNVSAMGGITYNFNLRSKGERAKYYVEKGLLDYTANPDSLPRFMNYIQIEDISRINQIDTIIYVYTDTIRDPELLARKKQLEDELDRLKRRHGTMPDDTPLDSILRKRMLPYEMVFFDLDKWDIRPEEEMKIAKMARVMKAYPDYTFTLYGSADSKTGTVKRNLLLGINRATVVKNRLVSEYGIPESQLKVVNLGRILDYDPFILNRTTVIIMDHPAVRKGFEAMKAQRKAGGGVVEY